MKIEKVILNSQDFMSLIMNIFDSDSYSILEYKLNNEIRNEFLRNNSEIEKLIKSKLDTTCSNIKMKENKTRVQEVLNPYSSLNLTPKRMYQYRELQIEIIQYLKEISQLVVDKIFVNNMLEMLKTKKTDIDNASFGFSKSTLQSYSQNFKPNCENIKFVIEIIIPILIENRNLKNMFISAIKHFVDSLSKEEKEFIYIETNVRNDNEINLKIAYQLLYKLYYYHKNPMFGVKNADKARLTTEGSKKHMMIIKDIIDDKIPVSTGIPRDQLSKLISACEQEVRRDLKEYLIIRYTDDVDFYNHVEIISNVRLAQYLYNNEFKKPTEMSYLKLVALDIATMLSDTHNIYIFPGCEIGVNPLIGSGCNIKCKCIIKNNCIIKSDVTIESENVVINSDVVINNNVKILTPITIGSMTVLHSHTIICDLTNK